MNDNYENETIDGLDETLDDLADLPANCLFPAGAYVAKVTVKRNMKKPGSYIVDIVHKETIELTNPEAAEPNPMDKTTIFVHTKKKDGTANVIGQGQLKTILKPFSVLAETNAIGEILEATKEGVDCAVVLGIRKSKDENYEDSQTLLKLEVV